MTEIATPQVARKHARTRVCFTYTAIANFSHVEVLDVPEDATDEELAAFAEEREQQLAVASGEPDSIEGAETYVERHDPATYPAGGVLQRNADGNLMLDTKVPTTTPESPVFLVIQEGGASGEVYAHVFETETDAESYRADCTNDGSYRTSVPLRIPRAVADHPQFFDIATMIAGVEFDYG